MKLVSTELAFFFSSFFPPLSNFSFAGQREEAWKDREGGHSGVHLRNL